LCTIRRPALVFIFPFPAAPNRCSFRLKISKRQRQFEAIGKLAPSLCGLSGLETRLYQ
jgi:hypothetical protein